VSRCRFLVVAGVALGCAHLDTTPPAVERGTLGEEIVRVFCEQMAAASDPTDVTGLRWKPVCRGQVPPPADAPPRLRALMANRGRLARALDRTLPEELHDDLGRFLGRLLPLVDTPTERVPRSTRLLVDLLEALAADGEALEALARVGTREGYRPARLRLGLVRPVLAYPALDEFVERALAALTDLPDDPGDGIARAEFRDLLGALALELATLEASEPAPPGDRTTPAIARDLFFAQDPAFGAGPAPHWVLARDSRGLALPAGGAVRAPLIDRDGDGLADTDALGRFVGMDGAPVDIPAPFRVRGESGVPRDAGGRALRSDATRYWEYVDVEHSLLAGVVREAGPLLVPDAPALLRLARGLPAILGPETELAARYGAATLRYRGPDTRRGPLLAVVHALAETLHRDAVDSTLALAETLIRDHEREVAGMIGAIDHLLQRSDAYPAARLEQPNVFWDEMIDMASEWAGTPGLLEAVMRALADPRSAQLGAIYGELMRHRDLVDYNPADPNGDPIGLPLDERVDRSRADIRGNESLFQRSIALIDGLNGVRVCNREGAVLRVRVLGIHVRWPLFRGARECEIIDIRNVAEAYALAILGRYELELQDPVLDFLITEVADPLGIPVDVALEQASGIRGLTRRPTPQALNRLVFWGLDHRPGMICAPATPTGCNSEFVGQLFNRVRDRHGNDVIDTYRGTIFAWEQPGFYSGMTPLLEALHEDRLRYDSQGRYRFGDMIARLHRHWASREHWLTRRGSDPAAPNFSYQDGGRSYEDLIADGFVEGRLLERLQRLLATVDGIEVAPGQDGIDVLAEASRDLLLAARSPGLATRDGRREIPWNDGSRRFAVTPLLLLLDALRAMDRELDAQPTRRDAWRGARDVVVRRFLGPRRIGESFEFQNRRARVILLHLLAFLRERLADHRARGDLVEWSRSLVLDTEEALRSPLTSALVRLLDRVQDDPEATASLARLVQHLTSEESPDDALLSTIQAAADLLFVVEDDENLIPIARAFSRAVAPDAPDVVLGRASALNLDRSVVDDVLGLAREIQRADDRRTLPRLLANLVRISDDADEVTPLEEILDVMREVNRAVPGDRGAYLPDDYRSAIGHATDFLRDEHHGLERLYDVVQEREIR
jgi:hypothetical protein